MTTAKEIINTKSKREIFKNVRFLIFFQRFPFVFNTQYNTNNTIFTHNSNSVKANKLDSFRLSCQCAARNFAFEHYQTDTKFDDCNTKCALKSPNFSVCVPFKSSKVSAFGGNFKNLTLFHSKISRFSFVLHCNKKAPTYARPRIKSQRPYNGNVTI